MLLNDPYQKKLLFSISILSCTLLVTGCWCCFSFEKWTFRLLFIVVRWWWRWWWWRRRWFFFLFIFILLLGVVVFWLFCCFLTLYRIQMKREKKRFTSVVSRVHNIFNSLWKNGKGFCSVLSVCVLKMFVLFNFSFSCVNILFASFHHNGKA